MNLLSKRHPVIIAMLLLTLSASGIAYPSFAQDAGTEAVSVADAPADAALSFDAALSALPEASYSDKESLLQQIAVSGHPQAGAVIRALLDGRLLTTADGAIVIAAVDTDTATADTAAAPTLSVAATGAAAPAVLPTA